MFARLSAIAALAAFVVAIPSPDTPAASKVGGECTVTWAPDTTGLWNSSYIELMAGSNFPMQHITTLASGVDMTSTTNTSYTFTCPNVTPNSDIYFLQFTSVYVPAAGGTTWTSRFLIAGADGSSTPPAQATQPDSAGSTAGKPIGWGNGTLVDAAAAVPAPTDVGASAAGASTPAAGASASAGASGASVPAGVSTPAAGGASASGPSASAPAGASKSGPAATGTNKVAAAPSSSNSGSAPAPSGSAPASGSGAARTGVASLAAVGAFALAAAARL